MALTKIENFLAETQTAIQGLNSSEQSERDAVTAKINLIIDASSKEVISRIGFDPIQSENSTRKYITKSLTSTLRLKEPVRTITTLKVNGSTVDTNDYVLVDNYTIRLTEIAASAGSDIEITGKFGLYDNLDAMSGSVLQSVTNAITYQKLFKFGTITSRNQGSDSSNYRGDSWLNRSSVDSKLLAFEKTANLE